MQQLIETLCLAAKQASDELAQLSSKQKQAALLAMAEHIEQCSDEIVATNLQDVQQAEQKNQTAAFIDRLRLDHAGVLQIVNSIKKIAALPEPVGKILKEWDVASGLHISRVSVPLGVIAVIYESRPNVTADAAALCLKSGNAVILRGGSECAATNRVLTQCLQDGLHSVGVDSNAIQMVPMQDRAAIDVLLAMDDYIDVVIPRGGRKLIEKIVSVSKIPVFRHLDGICHTYVHQDADSDMACDIILNAKMRRTGICGATETVLIDSAIAKNYAPSIVNTLLKNQCEVRGDAFIQTLNNQVKPASEADWSAEYLDAIVAIKVVDGVDAAIAHINHYGSQHTDAIITANQTVAATFLQRVNSAIAMHNCSTQFADGGEFGMGAEIGIATGKLHARGPVGIEQLTTFKYWVSGDGQVRGV